MFSITYIRNSMLINLIVETSSYLKLGAQFIKVKLLLLLSCVSCIKARKYGCKSSRNKGEYNYTKHHQEYAENSFKTSISRHVTITYCCHSSNCKVKGVYVNIKVPIRAHSRTIPAIPINCLLGFS